MIPCNEYISCTFLKCKEWVEAKSIPWCPPNDDGVSYAAPAALSTKNNRNRIVSLDRVSKPDVYVRTYKIHALKGPTNAEYLEVL